MIPRLRLYPGDRHAQRAASRPLGWLGHRSITSTAVYTALAPNRFKDFWREWCQNCFDGNPVDKWWAWAILHRIRIVNRALVTSRPMARTSAA
jgi:hypothetical protein